jgi:RNA polymerase-binding transcription factor DksA
MTTTKTELHDVLIKLHEDLDSNLKQMEDSKMLDITGTGYTNHQADDATAVYDQTADASAYIAIQTRLRQVEEAIAKYKAGTYGVCENCGREIDIARLEAMPYTPLCLRCAESRDYRAGM